MKFFLFASLFSVIAFNTYARDTLVMCQVEEAGRLSLNLVVGDIGEIPVNNIIMVDTSIYKDLKKDSKQDHTAAKLEYSDEIITVTLNRRASTYSVGIVKKDGVSIAYKTGKFKYNHILSLEFPVEDYVVQVQCFRI